MVYFNRGVVYISGIIPIFKITVMCSTHTSHTRHIHFFTHPTPAHFYHFYFDTHFDKLQQNQSFPHFLHHQKSPLNHQKITSIHWKSNILSKSTKKSNLYHKITPQNIFNSISKSLKTSANQYFPTTLNSQNRTYSVEAIIPYQKIPTLPTPVILHPIINNTPMTFLTCNH